MEDLSHEKQSKSIQDLDDLTLLDIFDLLDMKTLILCTAVCKSWNRVVESFPKYMGKMKLKFHRGDDTKSSFTTSRKIYQHVEIGDIGYGSSIFDVSSSFMSSLSNFAGTLKNLTLQKIQVERTAFINCICDLVNLKELTLDSVKCVNDKMKYQKGTLSPPQLTSLTLKNCENPTLMNALILLNIQSRHIEFSYSINMKQIFLSLIGQQSYLEHLIVTKVLQQNIEHLMEQLNEFRIILNDLKSLVIFDRPDRYNTPKLATVHTPIFLTTHASNLRELHLEDHMDFAILQAIASNMELETLSYRNLEIPKEKMAELKPNLHLKRLFSARACRLNELSVIFPSVETLKTSFAYSQPMDVIGNFKSLVNLHMEVSSTFAAPPTQMTPLKVVVVDLGQLAEMQMFLKRNSEFIEILIIKILVELHTIFLDAPSPNQYLNFLSKFKRVVLTSSVGCDLEFLEGGTNMAQYSGKVNIEASPTVIQKAKNRRGVSADTVSLLRLIPEWKIRELEKMFEMNLGTIKHGADPVYRRAHDEFGC